MALKRFIFATDIHGDNQDESANHVLFKFDRQWEAQIRICGGDLFDFRPLRKGASDDEKRESLRNDLKAGKDWFNRFKPTHFLRGNHDERLWELAVNGTGVASDFAQEGVNEIEAMVDYHRCQMLPYHKREGVLRLGKLNFIHGFFNGVNAARQTALVYGSTLFGHNHIIDEHPIPGLERRVARCVGALCNLNAEYNMKQPQTLRQAHGFAYGFINEKTGNYYVWQAEEVDGKWILPTDYVEL